MYIISEQQKNEALPLLRLALKNNNIIGTPTIKILKDIIKDIQKDNWISFLNVECFEHFTKIKL